MKHDVALTETARLAMRAREGLSMVAAGEHQTMTGWLIYGAALNKGRELFKSDELFGQWVKGKLPDTEQKEREAAMWAAANPNDFQATRKAHPRVRTVRGLHAKWKQPEPQPEKRAATLDDLRKVERLQALRDNPEYIHCENLRPRDI